MLDLVEILADLRAGADRAWQLDAACVGQWERLDPIVGGAPTEGELLERTRAAQELCASCPVARACAAAADLHYEPGVWGGSLRHQTGGPRGGTYVVRPLIPEAVPSIHENEAVAARPADKRELVAAAVGEGP